jgi:hypothetical protein
MRGEEPIGIEVLCAPEGVVVSDTRNLIVSKRVEPIGRVLTKVTLGTHRTAEELETATWKEGNKVSPAASRIFKKITVAQVPVELELVVVSGEDLGFRFAVSPSEIRAKAQVFGLQICPAEVGPQLRRAYKTQRRGECLLIAMDPILDSDHWIFVFDVAHDADGLCLNTGYDGPGTKNHPAWSWVFVRPVD